MIKTFISIFLILSVLPLANAAYELYNDGGLDYYISHLNDGDNLTRLQAITHIVDLKDAKGLLPLIEIMRSDGDWKIRAAAAKV